MEIELWQKSRMWELQVTGVAVGTAVGAPQVGLAAGQIVGGLVEQGGNELFHFEQTDRIAHRMARSAAFRQPRAAPPNLSAYAIKSGMPETSQKKLWRGSRRV